MAGGLGGFYEYTCSLSSPAFNLSSGISSSNGSPELLSPENPCWALVPTVDPSCYELQYLLTVRHLTTPCGVPINDCSMRSSTLSQMPGLLAASFLLLCTVLRGIHITDSPNGTSGTMDD